MTSEQKRTNLAIGILKDPLGRVLIVKRLRPEKAIAGQQLTWVFPGGPVHEEDGFTPEEALARHFRDETGYKINPTTLISERDYPQPYVHLKYFECVLAAPTLQPINDVDEIESAKWVEPTDLKNYFTTDIDPVLAKYLKIT